ncbi:SLC13A5 [Cordylochernes scorpioides]|uniref:SLC13A5 n=1 Tax=Cordylochernes scorpioides TaxID=51811 RepID=A0ABY6LGN6_9ARAC|nr:SLC13A5 [Cordylochernes scorpioides]
MDVCQVVPGVYGAHVRQLVCLQPARDVHLSDPRLVLPPVLPARLLKFSPRWTSQIHRIVRKKYEELGSITFPEATVIFLYLLLIILWFLRDPKFMGGWAQLITTQTKIGDATPAILVSLLLFLIPSDPQTLGSPPILDWETVQSKMPWGVMLLLAGGFGLAEGAKKSGLSLYVGQQLAAMPIPSPFALLVVLCLITTSLTEIVTNATAASVLLPLISQLCNVLHIHPFYLMVPVTVCASYAFMLPVATPPNAVVFESGRMTTWDMVHILSYNSPIIRNSN